MLEAFSIPATWIVLGVLIATSSSLMGLLSIWAAWSPRHWFLRTAVVAGVLLLAVPIPAYEPMLVFLIQAIVVTAALAVVEARRESRPRFSLSTLLLLVAIAAVAFAVAARIPAEVWAAWMPIACTGICLGVITLLATWAALSRRRGWVRAAAVLVIAAIVSIPQALAIAALPNFDALLFDVWTLFGFYMTNAGDLDTALAVLQLTVIWPLLLGWLTALLVALWLILCRRLLRTTRHPYMLNEGKDEPSRTPGRWATPAGVALALVTLAVLLPPASVYLRLLNPTPKPHVVLPSPNAYDDFVQLGGALTSNVIDNYDTASQAALKSEITKHAAALARAHAALKREFHWPLTYTLDDISMDDIQAFRQVGRAFTAEGRLAQFEGRLDDAVRIHWDTMRLGDTVSRSPGLLIHYLVGEAIEGNGMYGLIDLRAQLSSEQSKDVIEKLERTDAGGEPFENTIARDQVWSEYALGWTGRLSVAIGELTGGPEIQFSVVNVRDIRDTELRLLIAELALRIYQLEHGALPKALAELVPEHVSDVPYDPYGDGPLKYRVTDSGYLLYSVGPDGKDDDGRPMDDTWSDGDYFIDTRSKQWTSTAAPSEDGDEKNDAGDGEKVEGDEQ